jgi:hypothetical protein
VLVLQEGRVKKAKAKPERPKPRGRGISAPQEAYAAARAKGLSQVEAARQAGSKRPYEAGSRWERHPKVKLRIATLRKAAEALTVAIAAQDTAQGAEATAQGAAQGNILPAIADLAEVLQYQSHAMRTVGVRKVKRSWMEYEKQEDGSRLPVEVEATVDGAAAAESLRRHYDGLDKAPVPMVDQRQQAIVLVAGEEGRELLRQAARLLGSGQK